MDTQNIPSFVLATGFFTDAELQQLASYGALPSPALVDAFQYDPEIQELMNAFIGDESSRQVHQYLKAREFLAAGAVEKAWKIILL